MEDTPLQSFTINKLNRAIYYIVYKRYKKAKKWIYNKVDIINIFIVLYLINILVKYRQVNPYIDTHSGKIIRYRFSLTLGSALGLVLGKALFLYTRKVFAFKWVQEDFPYNNKQSVQTYKGTASDYKQNK